MCRGRVRAKLFNEDGTPFREDITNRKQLYLKIAAEIKENIKKHPMQVQKPQQPKKQAGGGATKSNKKKKKKK
jgi:hypothetical protein|eukprot:COSAG01_NODE_1792_length_9219_cov_4.501644_3_plen_73_part_00